MSKNMLENEGVMKILMLKSSKKLFKFMVNVKFLSHVIVVDKIGYTKKCGICTRHIGRNESESIRGRGIVVS